MYLLQLDLDILIYVSVADFKWILAINLRFFFIPSSYIHLPSRFLDFATLTITISLCHCYVILTYLRS
jgi:hypothetical protein